MHFPPLPRKKETLAYYYGTQKNFPAQVDNLNAKCKPFNAVARAASICRLGVYNIIQKKFKRIKEEGETQEKVSMSIFLTELPSRSWVRILNEAKKCE